MTKQQWKRWGAELRHHRTSAGMTQAALAKAMHVASPTVSAFERGTRTPSRERAIAADETLAAGGGLTQLWEELNDVREIPEDWRDFEKVERQAVEIREYQATLVPGLLQNKEYVRTLLHNTGVWNDDQIDRLVAARTARLGNIGETALTFVVDEIVLRRVLGTPEVLRGQLDQISKLIRERRVKVLVIPQYAPLHPGPAGSFRVMTLGDGRLVAHEEYRSGVNVVTGPRVNRLVTLFGNLQGEAYSPGVSAELIDTIRKEV